MVSRHLVPSLPLPSCSLFSPSLHLCLLSFPSKIVPGALHASPPIQLYSPSSEAWGQSTRMFIGQLLCARLSSQHREKGLTNTCFHEIYSLIEIISAEITFTELSDLSRARYCSRSFICINSFNPLTPSVVDPVLIYWEFPCGPDNSISVM